MMRGDEYGQGSMRGKETLAETMQGTRELRLLAESSRFQHESLLISQNGFQVMNVVSKYD